LSHLNRGRRTIPRTSFLVWWWHRNRMQYINTGAGHAVTWRNRTRLIFGSI
jgi:hypothetical protein